MLACFLRDVENFVSSVQFAVQAYTICGSNT